MVAKRFHDGQIMGMTLPVPQALIQISMFLAAMTFMYVSARAVGDADYRTRFMDPLIDDLRLTLVARSRYRAAVPAHRFVTRPLAISQRALSGSPAMKAISRVVVALMAAIAALFTSTGTSHAGLDDELTSPTARTGRSRSSSGTPSSTACSPGPQPSDPRVVPLRRARYNVAGPGADEFEGTLELGYQVGFPWALGVGINFSSHHPQHRAR